MRMSKLYMPTLREAPSDSEIASHTLFIRAGMMRKLVSGVYSYLPLGFRVLKKVEAIVREEMDRAGSQEVLLSAIQPREIWEATGRWDNFGPEMWKLKDRNNREFCLGPTHEEYFTTMIHNEVRSYKQLPLNLYQIQTKYRDEKRPRFGVIRAREFLMKDAYSFDKDHEGMVESYMEMWRAYDKVFKRLNLKFRIVMGDSGTMGGKVSHEFMALSSVGEGLTVYCDHCDFAATDERAEVVYQVVTGEEKPKEMEKLHTPGMKTIEDLAEFLGEDKSRFAKAMVYEVKGEPVIAFIPGDRELNEIKFANYLKVNEEDIEIASDELIKSIGAEPGFTGPLGISENTRIIVDERVSKMKNVVVGANEEDYHIKNVCYGRDFEGEVVSDLIMVREGDVCPSCGESLKAERGIEVGNIFQLGTRYSEDLGASYLDENGKDQPLWMGSYGIGVSRTVAAIIEQYHDEHGIIWPLNVAPYHAIITIVNTKDEEQSALGEKIYDMLSQENVEVLLDDRNERAGVKFNDRDLIGIPIRITVGKKAKDGIVEYSHRDEEGRDDIEIQEIMPRIREKFAKENLRLLPTICNTI